MATSNNKDIAKFWDAYGDRSAARIKAGGLPLSEIIPEPKRGHDKLRWSVGDKVVTTGNGQLRAGLTVTITSAWLENGHAKYLAGGVINLSADIEAV